MRTAQTLEQLRDKVLTWLSQQGQTGVLADIITQTLKANHTRRLVAEPWTFMRWPRRETFSVAADQTLYGLSNGFLFPRFFRLRSAERFLIEVTDQNYLEQNWEFDSTGDPVRFEFAGRFPVRRQPSVAAVVTATAASDAGKTVTLTGIDSSGDLTEETVTVGSASTALFESILAVRKNGDDAWTGTLTLSTVADGTILSLGASEYGKSYPYIRLLETPSSADTVDYEFYRTPRDLEDNDVTDIPPPFEDILVYDTLLEVQGYARSTEAELREWARNRDTLELAMQQTFLEGHTLGAAPNVMSIPYR
jgi:hypothetical protein